MEHGEFIALQAPAIPVSVARIQTRLWYDHAFIPVATGKLWVPGGVVDLSPRGHLWLKTRRQVSLRSHLERLVPRANLRQSILEALPQWREWSRGQFAEDTKKGLACQVPIHPWRVVLKSRPSRVRGQHWLRDARLRHIRCLGRFRRDSRPSPAVAVST